MKINTEIRPKFIEIAIPSPWVSLKHLPAVLSGVPALAWSIKRFAKFLCIPVKAAFIQDALQSVIKRMALRLENFVMWNSQGNFTSVSAFTDWAQWHGVDYRDLGPRPYRFSSENIFQESKSGELLQVPASVPHVSG